MRVLPGERSSTKPVSEDRKAPPNNNGPGGTGPPGSTTPDCTADPTAPGCP